MNTDVMSMYQLTDRIVTPAAATANDFGSRQKNNAIVQSISFSDLLDNALKAEFKKG